MPDPDPTRRADPWPDVWAEDVAQTLRASRRTAWIIAAVAAFVGAIEGLALLAIMPLATVAPFTLTFDRSTGYVSAAEGLAVGPPSQDLAITRAFLAQYVLNREGFDAHDAQAAADRVSNWSAGVVRSQHLQMLDTRASLPAGAKLRVTIKDVEILSRTRARVRFDIERRAAGEYAGARYPYSAAIDFRHGGAPLRTEDRLINPQGFQVTAYRRDAETIGVASRP